MKILFGFVLRFVIFFYLRGAEEFLDEGPTEEAAEEKEKEKEEFKLSIEGKVASKEDSGL